MSFKIFVIFIATCLYDHATADAADKLKILYVETIMECIKDFPVPIDEIQAMSKQKAPETDNAKCLLACSYKKTGMTDDEGKLSLEGIKKISEEAFADSPKLRLKTETFIKACLSVNDIEVTGDKKECERAALIFKCSVESESSFVS